MFDQLFHYPGVVRRHRDGPLAFERVTYLTSLATRGIAPETLLKYARYCLAIAYAVEAMPRDRSFTGSEIDRPGQDLGGRSCRASPSRCTALAAGALPGDRHGVSQIDGTLDAAAEGDHVPMHVKSMILSPPSNATDCGLRARATFGDGTSSGFCPISRRPTASWRRSRLSIWTLISNMPRSAGAGCRCDRRR